MRRIITALAVSATLCALAVPAAASRTSAAKATEKSPLKSSAVASSVTLPTGDAVLMRTVSGRSQVSVVAADRSGPQGQFETVRNGGDTYVFPAEVRPFIGSVLDPSLFDVTALAANHSGRIPVVVTSASGGSFRLPGFTATAHAGSVTSGYLAASGASAFRTALVAAWHSVSVPGSAAATSLFGGVTHLSVAHTAVVTKPDFPQVTLIIKVLDSAGKPASGGFINIINTDDARKFLTFAFYSNGAARVSLPYGHYSAMTDVATFSSTSAITDRIIPVADYTVSRNLQTLTFDARTATAALAVHTPEPTMLNSETVELDRDVPNGGMGSEFGFGPGSKVFVAPTPEVQHGELYWLTTWSLVGKKTGSPSTYDLSFLNSGTISADQTNTVAAFQLATVHARYYDDSHRKSQFVRFPLYPFQFGVFAFFAPLDTPQARTEYIYSPSSAAWIDQLIAYPTRANPFGGMVSDDLRYYAAGSVRDADWLRGPLAPSVPAETNGDPFFFCNDCRTATTLSVFLAPVTDTTPGHSGGLDELEGGPPVAHFTIYRNGALIGGGPDLAGGQFPVPAGAATYRIHDTTNRSVDLVKTSTTTSTDLTFRSAAKGGAGIPTGWFCGIGAATSCTVLPMLHATVPLPTTLSDTLPVGTSTFDFTVSRVQGAAPATITAASLATSVKGGPFVKATVVAVGHGVFRATLVTPSSAAGSAVTLRVTGADSAGSTISQTVTAAYLVAAA